MSPRTSTNNSMVIRVTAALPQKTLTSATVDGELRALYCGEQAVLTYSNDNEHL